MRWHSPILLAGAALAGAAAIGLLACGSSAHPPVADFDKPFDAGGDGSTKRVSSTGSDGRLCSDDTPGAPREPSGGCSCDYAYGPNFHFTLPCGVTLCSDGKNEAAICSLDGTLTVRPGYNTKNCPQAPDGGAQDPTALPPCDAGTPTPRPTPTDASPQDDDASTQDAATADASG